MARRTRGKRANGSGSVFRRQGRDGWTMQLVIDGKTVQRQCPPTVRTEHQAARALDSWRADVAAGAPVQPDRSTVESFLTAWLEEQRRIAPPATYRARKAAVECRIVPGIGQAKLVELTRDHVRRLYAALQMPARGTPYAPATIEATAHILHLALESAVEDGLITRNPASGIRTPPVPRREPKAVTDPARIREILIAVISSRYADLFALAIATGLRLGELLALHWSDVDLDRRLLRVTGGSYRPLAGGLAVGPTKSGRHRQVPLTEAGVNALRRQRTRQASERLATGAAWRDQDLVFPNTTGGVAESGVPRRHLRKAGLNPHALRHSFATLALELGIPTKVVSEWLGHSSTAITSDVYQSVTERLQDAAIAALDAVLPANPGAVADTVADTAPDHQAPRPLRSDSTSGE